MQNNAVEDIKARLSIVEVVGQYVQLKKAGRSYKGLCPFHNEKTPSFMVSPDKQLAYCFGCRKGGDIFAFVQEVEGIDFGEALRVLAEKAGVQLEAFESQGAPSEKDALFAIHETVTAMYEDVLAKHPAAAVAREYLQKRGVTEATQKQFRIGYSLPEWETARTYLKSKKYSDEQLHAAGLTIARDGKDGAYDRFRGRIMFPIQNMQGRIVGFSGRLLEDKENEPKYLNTSDTVIFHKGTVLYGMPAARDKIRSEQKALFVEGQMDVIALHQAGFTNAVATSGTALTETHLKLIRRFATNVLFAFDRDRAGIEATKRALSLAARADITVGVITSADAKDPDELLQTAPESWARAYESPLTPVDFYIDVAHEGESATDLAVKKTLTQEILSFVEQCASSVDQEHYLKAASDRLGISLHVLQKELHRTTSTTDAIVPVREVVDDRIFPKHEELLVGLLVHYPGLAPTMASIKWPKGAFSEAFEEFYSSYASYYNAAAVNNDFQQPSHLALLALTAERAYGDTPETELVREVHALTTTIVRKFQRRELQALTVQLRTAETARDTATVRALLQKKQELIASL